MIFTDIIPKHCTKCLHHNVQMRLIDLKRLQRTTVAFTEAADYKKM